MWCLSSISSSLFLSTPSARRATPPHPGYSGYNQISIHALREEGDHGEIIRAVFLARFLSTPSARRATDIATCQHRTYRNFYPRPPRGGRLQTVTSTGKAFQFLSTPSARRATARRFAGQCPDRISIHALREEGDPGFEQLLHDLHHFYPRPPRGGRQHRQRQTVWKDVFLSTPSARRATFPLVGDVGDHLISIHALREEGDPRLYRGTADAGDFYPRPPRGGRLEQQAAMSYNSAISIHALREEGDARTRAIMCLTFTFLSTPSARRATTAYQRQTCSDTDFYPRPPRGGRPLALSLEPCDQLISIHALREEGDWMFYLFLVSL